MLINNDVKISSLNNKPKINDKNTHSDEFQATLNALKNKEKKEYKKNNDTFNNTDLNLHQNFNAYAWDKLHHNQYKKSQNNIINNLLKQL
ncbi:hypothetical protein [Campylobacter sp.]|uniref:hypothetical protein n=1 Tax=Campylobacter sp. TaxID=205 RepID=UPI0025C5D14A|nr:hypothetical protein [Campylobacter sp.]